MTSVAMNFRITAKPAFRDVTGRFEKANKGLIDSKRQEMRTLGQTAVRFLRAEAPRRSGDFAKGIRYQTREVGDDIRLTTSSPQPLGKYIIGGTSAHIITPRGSGYPLRFVANGELVFTYLVNHPGTKPNPYHERAWRELRPYALESLRHISRNYTTELV